MRRKNYCERRNELSWWRLVALPNCHIHLCLFKLGYQVHACTATWWYLHSLWRGKNPVCTQCHTFWDIGNPGRYITGYKGQGPHASGCSIVLHDLRLRLKEQPSLGRKQPIKHAVNPFLFIRGHAFPSSIQSSLSPNCLMLTIPGFLHNCLLASCGDIGFLTKILGLVLAWKSGSGVTALCR